MNFKIAICDDELGEITYLTELVKNWASQTENTITLTTFSSAEAFLFHYSEEKDFDILLLDIEMKAMNGVELAKHLRKENCRAEIIFITSHFEFYGEGYEVDALHYLIKPVSKDKLFSVLGKASEKRAVSPPSIVITCEGETLRLEESEILYVEAFLHYIVIHTNDCEYKIKESLTAFAEKLSKDFYRIHRSYLVSLKHITRISRTTVTVARSIELPLARGKYDDVNRTFIEQN